MDELFRALWPEPREDEQLVFTTLGSSPETFCSPVGIPLDVQLDPSRDWYFGVASRSLDLAPGATGVGGQCLNATCLFLDIDLSAPGHKATNLPLDYQARDMLEEAELPEVSALIHTGGGWHAYWFLDQPHDVRTGGEWHRALRGLQQKCKRIWTRHGFHIDSTVKITQILRVPGTKNWKTGVGRDVHVLHLHPNRIYSLSQFKAELGRPKKSSPEADGLHPRNSSSPLSAKAAHRGRAVSGEDFLGRLKDDLLAGPHADLFELVYAGKRFAEAERDNTLQALCSRVAFAGRRLSQKYATVATLLHVFDDTMAAYVDDEYDLEENLAWAESKLERALVDADVKISATEAQDARLWAWFEKHTAKSENIVFEKGDAAELATWMVTLDPPKVFDRGSLYEYIGTAWVERTVDECHQWIVDLFADRIVQRPGLNAKDEPFAEKPIVLERPKVQGIYQLFCSLVAKPGFFDNAAIGYAFTNCFLRVTPKKTLERVDHDPEHRHIGEPFLEYVNPFAEDQAEHLAQWLAYHNGLLFTPGEQQLQLEFYGITLLGLAPRFKKCLSFVGGGDNGKSVFLNFMKSLFFENRTSEISPARLGDRFGSYPLRNSLLNSVEEVPGTKFTNTDNFKKHIGGSPVSTDVKHGSEFMFTPKAGHVFAFNELPFETVDDSDGYWSRFLLFPCRRQFSAEEKNPFQEEFLKPLRSLVASLCIEFARTVLTNNAYTIPPETESEVNKWRYDSNPVAIFVETKLARDTSQKRTAEELYMAYCQWSKTTHHTTPKSMKKFVDYMRQRLDLLPNDETPKDWPFNVRTFAGIREAKPPKLTLVPEDQP